MTICIHVNNYLNDKLLDKLSIPSSLFIKPNYYTNSIKKFNNDHDNIIDEKIYTALLEKISPYKKKENKLTRHHKIKPNKKTKKK